MTKKPNKIGLYDMSGNVWEQCWDYSQTMYTRQFYINPTGPVLDAQGKGQYRVLRGGCYNNTSVYCRAAGRNSAFLIDILLEYHEGVGFRLVRNVPKAPKK